MLIGFHANAVETIKFYVSTNDGAVAQSIGLCELELESGRISLLGAYPGARSPSYLTLSKTRDRLYSVAEGEEGKVVVFEIDPDSGTLSHKGSCESGGSGPCYISLTKDESRLLIANYVSGSLGVVELQQNGDFSELTQTFLFKGKGPNVDRQESSHMHYIHPSLNGSMVLACDLGSDKVVLFSQEKGSNLLMPNPTQNALDIKPGSGPRHLGFHPNGAWVFLLNELDATVDTLQLNSEQQTLSHVSRANLLPTEFEGYNKSAAIRVHPLGKFVYGSNRGELNSISIFQVKDDGSLERVAIQVESVDWPRDFAIDPTGKFLLVACRGESRIRVFGINQETGLLSDTGYSCQFPKPVCIAFLPQVGA